MTHILILILILAILFGPYSIPQIGRSIGDGMREFKKGVKGEGDIDVTDSVKRIEDDKSEPN